MGGAQRKDYDTLTTWHVLPGLRYARITEVPGYRISSIGDWHLSETGDGPIEIGYQRLYETMVFRIEPGSELCPCGCGMAHPERLDMSGLAMLPADTPEEADLNHELLVAMYLNINTTGQTDVH